MQPLTGDMEALLTGDTVEVSAGCEVLDLDLGVLADISDELVGGEVRYMMNARIHRTCRLDLSVELQWGARLVRPYMTLSDAGMEERFNLGVFMLTTPETPIGESPAVYSASGFDRLYLLDREVGEDYSVAAFTTYYHALVAVFTDAGLSGVDIDSTALSMTLPVEREWPLVATSTDPDQTDTPVTWLRIVNDLLLAANFRAVWCNENGRFQCQKYATPATRPVEFTFDVDDETATIVGEDRVVVTDIWKTPNRWVFLWSNRSGGMQAVEGDGMYTYDLPDDDPMSASSRGLVWTKVYEFEAASQDVLEEIGDRRVAADRDVTTTIKATTGPFPAAGHADVFALADSSLPQVTKVQAVEYVFDLAGGDVEWRWEAVG